MAAAAVSTDAIPFREYIDEIWLKVIEVSARCLRLGPCGQRDVEKIGDNGVVILSSHMALYMFPLTSTRPSNLETTFRVNDIFFMNLWIDPTLDHFCPNGVS